jgi:DNA-binding MarR family transcriptional regulator
VADLLSLFINLVRLEVELWETLEARLRREPGTSLGNFMVMRTIAGRPGCLVRDISNEFGLTAGGASKAVDRVERAGLCRRRPNPDDRRSSLLELTPAGTALLAQCEPVVRAELERLLEGSLPPRELDALARRLGAIRPPRRT